MGPDLLTGRTLFLLANGAIVPRRLTVPFPRHFVHFKWSPKPFVPNVHLPPSTPTTQTPPPTTETSTQPSPNIVIQLPDTPHTGAIATVTGHIPSPLSVDLLTSLNLPLTLSHPQATAAVPPSNLLFTVPHPPLIPVPLSIPPDPTTPLPPPAPSPPSSPSALTSSPPTNRLPVPVPVPVPVPAALVPVPAAPIPATSPNHNSASTNYNLIPTPFAPTSPP